MKINENQWKSVKTDKNQPWKSMEIMTKPHAKTYGSHEMVRVKIALSRAPERALIRLLYGPEGTTRTGKGAYPSPIRMHDLCRGWERVALLRGLAGWGTNTSTSAPTNTSTNTSIDTSINTDTSI